MAPSSSIQACPEKRLLVCCDACASRVTEEIVRLTAEPLDWDFLLRDARENALTPLVARHLSACASRIPSGITEALRESMRANVARSLMLTAELIRILDLLRSSGVTAIPYKGPTLAAQAYGDITLRQFDDPDIIIRQQDVPKSTRVTTGIGFSPDWRGRSSAELLRNPGMQSDVGNSGARDFAKMAIAMPNARCSLNFTGTHVAAFSDASGLASLAARLASVQLSGREVHTFAAEEAAHLPGRSRGEGSVGAALMGGRRCRACPHASRS